MLLVGRKERDAYASPRQLGSERQDLAGSLGPNLFPRDTSFPWPNHPAASREMLLGLCFTRASKDGSFLGLSPTPSSIPPASASSPASGLMSGAARAAAWVGAALSPGRSGDLLGVADIWPWCLHQAGARSKTQRN